MTLEEMQAQLAALEQSSATADADEPSIVLCKGPAAPEGQVYIVFALVGDHGAIQNVTTAPKTLDAFRAELLAEDSLSPDGCESMLYPAIMNLLSD